MKKIKFFALALAALTMLSCNKEQEDTIPTPGGDSNVSLALKINRSSATYALQNPGAAGATINSMIIEVFDVAGNTVGSNVVLTAAQITAATAPSGTPAATDESRIVIENIPITAAKVKIWAFQAAGVTNLPTLGNSINTYQTVFNLVPFYPVAKTVGSSTTDANGFISINKTVTTGATHTTHKIWTVEAELAPYFARFEVAGNATSEIIPKTAAATDFTAGTTITVTGIYMNNIADTKGTMVTTNTGNNANWGSGDWAGDYYGATAPMWTNMCNITAGTHINATALSFGSQLDCYNLFAQAGSPHLILRVKVVVQAGTLADAMAGTTGGTTPYTYYGFISIKDFTSTGAENGKLSVLGVKAGQIYKFALSDINTKVGPEHIAPDPETLTADLYATITITGWQSSDISAEL